MTVTPISSFRKRPNGTVPAHPTWRVSVYLGGRQGYAAPREFRWTEGNGHHLVAYSLGDPRSLGVTDVALHADYQGAAEQHCEAERVLRSDGGELALLPADLGCPSGAGAAPQYDGTTPFGDVDADGQDEVLAWTQSQDTVQLELLNAAGDVLASVSEAAGHNRSYVGVGDVTGDGLPDAVGFDSHKSELHVSLVFGTSGGIAPPTANGVLTVPSGALVTAHVLGDVNGDSQVDFELRTLKTPVHPDVERFVALSGPDATYALNAHSGPYMLKPAGDINCDGHDDLLQYRHDAALPPGQSALDVFVGSSASLDKVQSLTVSGGGNATEILPVTQPLHRRR